MDHDESSVALTTTEPRTANDIRGQVNRIQEVMKSVMKLGVHYGCIPGCGDKPALLKPGAEKLMMTFRMAVDPQVTDLSTDTVSRYRVLARVTYIPTGAFLGIGIGECSSNEEKYAWKKASVEQEWHEADPANRREKWMRGKQGSSYKVKQVRTNPSDVANTVLKMAKKRALIDGVLTVTAASDIFNQDIEDLDEETMETDATGKNESLKDRLKKQVGAEQPAATDTVQGDGLATHRPDDVVSGSAADPQKGQDAPAPTDDVTPPHWPYRQAVLNAKDEKAATAAYNATPEELRQDVFPHYQDVMKKFGKVRK
jgi:hypothetical protein